MCQHARRRLLGLARVASETYPMVFWEYVVNLLDIFLGNTLENEPTIARLVVRDARLVRFVQRNRWFSQRILPTTANQIVLVQQ